MYIDMYRYGPSDGNFFYPGLFFLVKKHLNKWSQIDLEAPTDGFMHQCRGDAGVDSAAHGAHDVLVLELVHDDVDLLLAEVVHVPLALASSIQSAIDLCKIKL